jgi:serine/threonine protein kinase
MFAAISEIPISEKRSAASRPLMAADSRIEFTAYCPPSVSEILATSFDYCIGRVDNNTVLKYLHKKQYPDVEAQENLAVEAQIYTLLGHHNRIVRFKGGDALHGLLLEYAANGSVTQYLKVHNPTTLQRLIWSQQAAEGIAYIHASVILHCDINTNNLLLDKDLNIKLADFQGRYLAPDGSVLLDGRSSENVKSSMPRSNPNHADQKTDIFALGSAIYYIMQGHEPFPELNSLNDNDESEIVARFTSGRFPPLSPHSGGGIVYGCWSGRYESAIEVVEDLKRIVEVIQSVECKA